MLTKAQQRQNLRQERDELRQKILQLAARQRQIIEQQGGTGAWQNLEFNQLIDDELAAHRRINQINKIVGSK